MNLSRVRIKNFKGIEEKELLFIPGFNLIKGENGKGKTSILEAISVGMGGFIAGIPEIATRHISINEIRKEYKLAGDGSCECNYRVPVEVEMEANFGDSHYHWVRTRTSVNSSRSTIQPRDIVRLAEELASNENSELPVLIYEAAGRVWEQKRQKVENPFGKKIVRTIGYMDTLLEASNIKMLRNWCIKMEMNEFKLKKEISEYEAAKKAVADFMQIINGDADKQYKVFYDSQLEELMFQNEEEILPISDLSAGYQSLIWMVFDIAYRMALLNPQRGKEVALTKGIVLIDEIDMHLHPKWQWNIVKALKDTFPNVQFIAATHSPIIISSCKQDNLITISKTGEISYAVTPYGFDVNEILSVFQGSYIMAEDVERLFKSFYQNLDAEKYDLAEKQLEQLKEMAGENNPKITGAEMALELEQIPLED